MTLEEITALSPEREYDPDGGSLGRGARVSPSVFDSIVEIEGYSPVEVEGQRVFPVYAPDGGLAATRYKAFVRKADGHYYAIALEASYI